MLFKGNSYLYTMKKNIIWLVGIIMGACCLGLIYMQVSYIEAMVRMRKQHFEEGVKRSLYQAAYELEIDETRNYLVNDIKKDMHRDFHRSQIKDGFLMLEHKYMISTNDNKKLMVETSTRVNTEAGAAMLPKFKHQGNSGNLSMQEQQRLMIEMLSKRYQYQRAMLDEVVYTMIYKASERPLAQRINFRRLDQSIKSELANNGIGLSYHFRVLGADGKEVYKCSDYHRTADDNVYKELIFKNDPPTRMGVLEINFPADILNNYIYIKTL